MNAPVIHHGSFTIARTYSASPSQVFAAWADAQAKYRWFVSGEGWDIAEATHDFRVGGTERSRFRRVGDETVYTNDSRYDDIIPDKRIVFAYSMARETASGPAIFSVSLATVELQPAGTGTRLVFTEQSVFLEGADGPKHREMGWNELLDKLGAELNRSASV